MNPYLSHFTSFDVINSVEEAVKVLKELMLNYSDEKLKEVLLFYFKELRRVLCKEHSPNPEPNCNACKEEYLRLEAIHGIAIAFSAMQDLGSR